MTDGNERDELLKRARRAQRRAGTQSEKKKADGITPGNTEGLADEAEDFVENVKFFNRSIKKLKDIFLVAANVASTVAGIAHTLVKPFAGVAKKVGGVYKNRVWDKHAYDYDEKGVMIGLNKSKAAKVALITAACLGVGMMSMKPAALTLRDAYHAAAATEGQTYFFGKPEYQADKGIYQVTACKSQTTCEGGDNALIFDIPDNRALDLSYTFTRAKGYDPEHEIVSAFNSEYQECTVTAFGSKPIIINYFFGTFKWHPKILDSAVCTPVVNMNGPSLTN